MKATVLILLSVFLFGAIEARISDPNTCSSGSLQFTADLTQPTTEWVHYWERCVGSGHATLALREDWREALELAHSKLGFQQVRFHGLFDDDMSVVLPGDNGQFVYSFYNVDNIFDYLLSIGVRPLVELSFMPELMASGNATIFHYKGNITPPQKWSQWTDLIVAFAKHIINRYGLTEVRQWHFETWNEPNCGFWSGNQTDYFQLLKVTVAALKSVDSQLSVGGPATCQSEWLPETLEFCKENNVPIDFISTHLYPTDIQPLTRRVMHTVVSRSRKIVGKTPLFYTEYNDGLFTHQLHDTIYASAFAVFNIIDVYGLPDIFSWWTFSDVFEEGGFNSIPFNAGYGLQTIYNIAKPAFRAFELLHQTGNQRVPLQVSQHDTAGALVTKNSTHLSIILYNHNIPNSTINTEKICMNVKGISAASKPQATLRRIDEDHCNPLALWQKMGSPEYVTPTQIQQLHAASQFQVENLPYNVISATELYFEVSVPPQGVVGITIPL